MGSKRDREIFGKDFFEVRQVRMERDDPRWEIVAEAFRAAGKGSIIKIVAQGPDASGALTSLEELVKNRFGEE